MKNIICFILLLCPAFIFCQSTEAFKEASFTVYGNCGMCKTTIEKAVKDVDGIKSGTWDRDTDVMTVVFNPSKIELDNIKQRIADVGYDSDTHRAKDNVYAALPGCCQYERPKAEVKSNGEGTSSTFTVYGNCGMCKTTIEKAVTDVKGIQSGEWDKETDQMTVVFDSEIISIDDIKQRIADAGYDSDTHRAKDDVYAALPGCCQYERPKAIENK